MIKIMVSLLLGTLLLAQQEKADVINKHPLEVGEWGKIDNNTRSDRFIKRHIDKTLEILVKNPNLEGASENDIWNYFLSTKTAKFMTRFKQQTPTLY